ncbi:MAG: RNA-binding protein [Bacteroidia bacterium]|nr:RNA-binding protein [Bacteroidia bacterium]
MNIFVAKLSSRTSSEDLERLFEVYGEVTSCKVIKDRDTGLSKGFGFVIMPNDDEAREAISNLDQSQVDGNTIVAKEAVPKDEWENKRGQRGGSGSGPRNDFRGGSSGGGDYRSGGGSDYRSGGGDYRSGGGSDYRSGGGNDYRSSGGGSDYRGGGGGGYRDSGSDYRGGGGGGGFRDGGYRSNDRGDRFNKGGGKRF